MTMNYRYRYYSERFVVESIFHIPASEYPKLKGPVDQRFVSIRTTFELNPRRFLAWLVLSALEGQ